MKIDIWLDIRCPNCCIAKRKFQIAFDEFEHRDKTSINWRSYELSPTLTAQPGKSVYEYLAELKGKSLEWSRQMHAQVAESAAEVGLSYNFEKAVIANSFHGHRLVQFAKTKGLASETIDRLFHAYFTDGADLSDHTTLGRIAESSGLPADEVAEVLSSDAYSAEVRADEAAASKILRGVPFFLYNNLKTVNGDHTVDGFRTQLLQAWDQYKRLLADPPGGADDDSCSIYGFC